MPNINATVTVPVEISKVYTYLRSRYESKQYRVACKETLGYVPPIACDTDVADSELTFTAPGRDLVTKSNIGGWSWHYRLESLAATETKISIEYRWGRFMGLFGLGTIKHQAANSLTDDILAIQALAA